MSELVYLTLRAERFPAEESHFSLVHNVQSNSGTHPASCQLGTMSSSPGHIVAQGFDDDHSPASSAEVKNEWSYTSTPPMCLYGVNRAT